MGCSSLAAPHSIHRVSTALSTDPGPLSASYSSRSAFIKLEMNGQMIMGRPVQGLCSQQSAEGGAQPMETQDVSGKGTAVAKSGASGAASR